MSTPRLSRDIIIIGLRRHLSRSVEECERLRQELARMDQEVNQRIEDLNREREAREAAEKELAQYKEVSSEPYSVIKAKNGRLESQLAVAQTTIQSLSGEVAEFRVDCIQLAQELEIAQKSCTDLSGKVRIGGKTGKIQNG